MLNIHFNNTSYNISEAALNAASERIKTHLSTTMSGSGATITLGGTSYSIDATKLSTATNSFVSHLGTIAGGSGGSDTLTWDGNTEGLECASNPIVDMTWYRVSDVVLSADDLVNGVSITTVKASDGEEQSMDIGYDTIQSVITDDGCIKATFFFSIPTDNYSLVLSKPANGTELTALFEKAGIYFYASGGIYTSRLTIPNYTGFGGGSGSKVTVGGVEYSVDSAKVQGAVAELESVLSGLGEERLEGDGAEYYTLAPTPLTFRSTAPLNELQSVQINGVTVDPSNYTLEEGSTIVTFPIDYLKTLEKGNYQVSIVSESKTVKGNFAVAAPELNEHGFYYNQPYSANLPMFGGDTAFFVREDGTYDIITVGNNPDTGEYTMSGNNIVANHPLLGTITCTISSDGTEVFCNELQTAFKLSNSTAITADEDYIYFYKEDLGGYEVKVIDKTKAEYGTIKTGINGLPTVKATFSNCTSLTSIALPDSVTSIGRNAFSYCTSLTSIALPDSVTSIGEYAFAYCTSLTSITIPDSVTSIDANAFRGCTNLTTVAFEEGSQLTSIGDATFYNCNSLTSITIPDSVTSIDANAFWGCTDLTTIAIEEGS
jgi:hypothetical protein